MEQIPLLLGSATPTLETWLRVQRRQDQLLSLPRRVEGLPLPPVVVVDVRNDPHIARGAAIGRALQTAMLSALRDGGQVILFLNLRGHSPTLWCHACGTAIRCPDCDVTLTWHRDRDIVRCHFCDYAAPPVRQCPQCASTAVRYFGIGTQRLEQEVAARFANYRCLRMDSDTMRRPGSHDEALEAFRRGEVQILLGTQMIAKGLDFPNVTLVGVVNADTMLHQPDLRAAERTFQLLAQVAGRTGRSARGGRVFVQSAAPSEPAIVLAAAHDYVRFATKELQHRHESHAPPYSRWCRIVLRGSLEQNVRDLAQQFSQQLRAVAESTEPAERAGSDVRILGPAPAPVARLKGLYRYHFLLAADELRPIQQLWTRVSPRLPTLGDVEFVVDVDPVNLR